MAIHAYIDESRRGQRYVVSLAVIESAHSAHSRRQLRSLLLPRERHFHTAKERPARRRQAISMITQLPVKGLSCTTRIGDHRTDSEEDARQRSLVVLIEAAIVRGATHIILDRRDSSQNPSDVQTIVRLYEKMSVAGPAYRHEHAAKEPLLWIPDVMAWSIARGGEWRHRLETSQDLSEVIKTS